MRPTAFDDLYSQVLSIGGTLLISSNGSNSSTTGGDIDGEPGDYSVTGLGGTVSLSSNLATSVLLGDVLTIIQATPATAMFATPSNSGGAAFGSNSTWVSETTAVGVSSNASRADHTHGGIATVTASSSNTMQRGTLNLRPGDNVSFGLTDSDGNGLFDTLTIHSTGGGGAAPPAGGGGGEDPDKYNPDHETPATTPDFAAEFNGSTDSFTFDSAPTTDDTTTYPGYRYILRGGTENWLSRSWSPSGDLTLAMKFSISPIDLTASSGMDIMFGVANGSTTSATDGVFNTYFAARETQHNWQGYTRTSSSYSGFGSSMGVAAAFYGTTGWRYLRLTRSGNTWAIYISTDGIHWAANSTTSKTFSPTHAVLRLADGQGSVVIDWIRGWTSVIEKVGA